MQALPFPPDGDQNRAPQLLALFWVPFPITVTLVTTRLFVRLRLKNLGWDDYLMFIAWVLYTVTIALSTVYVLEGGARHIQYLSPDQLSTVLKFNWIGQPFGIMAAASGKTSVGFMVMRVTGPNTLWRKWFLYISVGLYIGISIVASTLVFVQCSPARALWDFSLAAMAKCWKPMIAANVIILQSAYGTFLDFALALLPITIVYNLKLNLRKRIGLCILLGLGVLAGVGAAIKTAQLPGIPDRPDITWDTFGIFAWASIEVPLVIICGSIPAVKPLYDRLVKGKELQPAGTQYPSKRNYKMQPETSYQLSRGTVSKTGNTIKVSTVSEREEQSSHRNDMPFGARSINVQQTIDVQLQDQMSQRSLSRAGGSNVV